MRASIENDALTNDGWSSATGVTIALLLFVCLCARIVDCIDSCTGNGQIDGQTAVAREGWQR